MRININTLSKIIDKQYTNAELSTGESSAQSFMGGNMFSLFNILSAPDNFKFLNSLLRKSFGLDIDIDMDGDDDIFIYRHLSYLQERYKDLYEKQYKGM